ncbi:hypothetical protein NPIL_160441 [Nephila pilipes]|uniref:Uncharacterized protein n=1 Tax=Nephila pilipes TaxID=299642 RepID=A0A8X6MVI7_NEPPI|nr:hypothetical protein NPIL_160441 [Nephila pilipes]
MHITEIKTIEQDRTGYGRRDKHTESRNIANCTFAENLITLSLPITLNMQKQKGEHEENILFKNCVALLNILLLLEEAYLFLRCSLKHRLLTALIIEKEF